MLTTSFSEAFTLVLISDYVINLLIQFYIVFVIDPSRITSLKEKSKSATSEMTASNKSKPEGNLEDLEIWALDKTITNNF